MTILGPFIDPARPMSDLIVLHGGLAIRADTHSVPSAEITCYVSFVADCGLATHAGAGEGLGGDGAAGCSGVDPGEDVPSAAFVVVNGFVAVEREDVRGDRRLRVAEDEHVGESLPGFVQVRAIAIPHCGCSPMVLNAAS